MQPFSAKHLVLLSVMTSIQILPLQPTLANPTVPPQTNDSTPKSKPYNTGLELRSDTEGVDFSPYLRQVFLSIRRKWTGVIPESAKQGETGTVTVQFRIQQDGKVPNDSVKVVFSSGKKDMDDACLTVIRTAGPFEHLPEAFHSPSIELRQIFHFNPPKGSQ
jgi:TonB family protein